MRGLQVWLFLLIAVTVEGAFHLYQVSDKVLIYIDTWLIFSAALAALYLVPTLSPGKKTATVVAAIGIFVVELTQMTNPKLVHVQPEGYACLAREYMPPVAEGFIKYCVIWDETLRKQKRKGTTSNGGSSQ